MMMIDIFDVGHGGCTVITAPNGKRMMIDCGYRVDPGWFPSITFKGQRIDLLAISNLDEDHVEDLPYMWRDVQFGAMFSNPTVDAPALANMKRTGGMRAGVQKAHDIIQWFGAGQIGPRPDFGQMDAWAYFNRYGVDFVDTNNLSLAIFVRYGAFTMLYAGDMEKEGWRSLLRHPQFVVDLGSVNVFMASHHGRDSGCCDEVFHYCRPDVFVISDEEHRFDSQDMTGWYRWRAKGIPDYRRRFNPIIGYPNRYVMTTRRDGSMAIQVEPSGNFLIVPETRPLTASLLALPS